MNAKRHSEMTIFGARRWDILLGLFFEFVFFFDMAKTLHAWRRFFQGLRYIPVFARYGGLLFLLKAQKRFFFSVVYQYITDFGIIPLSQTRLR